MEKPSENQWILEHIDPLCKLYDMLGKYAKNISFDEFTMFVNNHSGDQKRFISSA